MMDLYANNTSPGTPGSVSSVDFTSSEMSLGSRISAFIHEQRSLSDELQNNSPKSVDSSDEIQQVRVDPENGLVLNTWPELLTVVEEAKKDMKPEKTATVCLKSMLSQSLITGYFSSTIEKIQTSSAAAYAAHVASQASSVPSNRKQAPQERHM